MMDGNTPEERLQLLEPQAEDWHCLVCFLKVKYSYIPVKCPIVHIMYSSIGPL